MEKGKLSRVLFIFASFVALLSLIFPCQTKTTISEHSEVKESIRFMPTIFGAVVFVLVIGGVVAALIPKKKLIAALGTGTAIGLSIKVLTCWLNAGVTKSTANPLKETYKELGATNVVDLEYTIKVVNSSGYYIMIAAILLMLCTSFLCLIFENSGAQATAE